jgi:formiminoglutamase
MTKPSITQSQKRFQESVGALFSKADRIPKNTCLFLKSSTDIGVIRNGGRNGARFAPQSFISTFKKFAQNHTMSELAFFDIEVSSQDDEEKDFHEAQKRECERIASAMTSHPNSRTIHIGGGHDHIYPLLTAASANYKKVIVINIDAHADTRTDENFHSGTPFRQFAREFKGDFHLFQIGLHPFANSFSTLTQLEKGKMDVLWMSDLNETNLVSFFMKIEKTISEKTLVVFSLDADALAGNEVPGVSAVNPAGLTRTQLLNVWKQYESLKKEHLPVIGIYELNPLYDTLASVSMRTIASFVFETF